MLYLTLEEFCNCTQTYRKYADQIDPYPKNWEETVPALEALCQHIIDPVIDEFGRERFQLTYGFCSTDLKRWLAKKNPVTAVKNGIASPDRDQHMAHEVNRNGNYYCSRLGAACDFKIVDLPSDELLSGLWRKNCRLTHCIFMGQSARFISAMDHNKSMIFGRLHKVGHYQESGFKNWQG